MNLIVKSFAKLRCDPIEAVFSYLWVHWKSVVTILVPLIFLPLALIGEKRRAEVETQGRIFGWGNFSATVVGYILDTVLFLASLNVQTSHSMSQAEVKGAILRTVSKEAECGYVICIMAIYWMTEVIPLPVTSLIPVVAFPLFGILSTEEVCLVYFKETNIMFLGGVIIAIAVEHCNLHKRIALRVLLMTGSSPHRLMLGFMLTTMFLSMWISNAAASAMMVPIVTAVLDELKSSDSSHFTPKHIDFSVSIPLDYLQHEEAPNNLRRPTLTESAGVIMSMHDSGTFDGETRRKSVTKINISETNRPTKDQICYFLGIAYAANIGGTGTITGTSTNLTFKGILDSLFPNAEGINFATWMQFNVPLMIFNTFLAYLWLQMYFMGLCRKKKSSTTNSKEQEAHVREVLHKSYEKLGPMTYHETNVLILFILDILLWFFRKPEFVTGWYILFPEKQVKDSTAAIAVVLLLFILPANLDFLKFDKKSQKESPALLNWKVLHEKIPFGIILLLGGGFAISKACEVSGLSDYLGYQLEVVKEYPNLLILSVTALAATFATEVSSNTAIANILLPVLAKMCVVLRINPLYLMLPTTICCSFAFMLPVATPPNAIVMAASNMKTSDMMKAGFGMNLICVISLIVTFMLIGVPMYDLNHFPEWAENVTTTVTF